MYTDASRNPITAAGMVDALLRPIDAGLRSCSRASGTAPAGVSVYEYNALVDKYNQLLEASERALLRMQLHLQAAEIERLRLLARLHARGSVR